MVPSLLPPERGKLNTNARLNIRPKNENRAQLGGEILRNDNKISATTSSTYTTRTQHGPSEGDNVGGPCAPPPRETALRAGHGGERAKKKGLVVH